MDSRQLIHQGVSSSLDVAAAIVHIDEALRHHIQLLQGVRVLRVLDVPDVLQQTNVGLKVMHGKR